MSVVESTGSACVDRFRSWATARMPEAYEVDDVLAGVELYQPEDLPELIEMFREAEKACMAAQNEAHMRLLDEDQQRIDQLRLKGELPRRGSISIEEELRGWVQYEFIERWTRRALFLGEIRKLLEGEPESLETVGGPD
jgi:hypothetical protein